MGLKTLVHVFVVILSCLVYSSSSYQFVVGGKDGWVLKPSESYLHWASRMRFQVNDTILFKYKSGSDSVLVVNKEDYDGCDVGSPLLKLDDGNSVVKFNRSGPFYFISGNKPNCDQGQKLITVVMAVRSPPSPPIVPPPTAAPPQGSSPTPSPAAGGGGGGAPAPATSPSSSTSPAPATSPSSSASPGPATSPSSTSPAPAGSGPSPAGGSSEPPSSSSTPGSPGSSTAGGPGGSSTPGSGTPADANSPPAPPRSTASPPCSASILVMSVVLSVGFGAVIVSH